MKFDSNSVKSSFRPELFWDVDFSKLDLDEHAAFIIVRVMENGIREEVRSVWEFYGKETIKHHLTQARYLSPRTISYFANLFKISRSKFRSSSPIENAKTWP